MGKTIVGLIVGVSLIGGGAYWAMNRDKGVVSQLLKGKIDRGTIRITVQATGTLEAVRTVQVGSQISGQISALHADYNSQVRKGQLLAEIDPRTFESQVLTEEAQNAAVQARMQSSQADLINQEANLVQVEANLKVAQVSYDNTKLLFERATQLRDRGLVPQSEYDLAKTNLDSADAKVDQAQAAISQAQAQIKSRQASIEQVKSDIVGAKAQLERAQINLELTKIFSPVDGVVISRSVDIGQTVAASLSAPILFLIANDLTHMQVKANIDEADIGKITPEVQVAFTVDAYPNDTFGGKISEVRLEPQTVQNVVTYSVIIAVENPQLKLKPGMTSNLTLTVEEHSNVLTAPNAALRFTPAGMTQESIAKLLEQSGGAAVPPPPGQNPGGEAQPAAGSAPADTAGAGAPRGGRGDGGGFAGGGPGGDGQRRGRGGNGGNFNGGNGQGGGRGGRGGRGGGGAANRRVVLWVEDGQGLKPIQARAGLTDGTRTEVSGPNVTEGMDIIVSDLSQVSTTQRPQQNNNNNPFAPQFPGGGRGRGF